MDHVCADSKSCQYDYVMTLDRDFAKITKEFEAQAHRLQSEITEKVIRCPALNKPLNGRKSENRYWPGTIVRFSCDDGYRLVGYEARKCREDGLWSWGVDPECISDLAYTGQIAGIGIGIVLPLIIIVVLAIGCFIYTRKSGNDYRTHERRVDHSFPEWKSSGNNKQVSPLGHTVSGPIGGQQVAQSIPTNAKEDDV